MGRHAPVVLHSHRSGHYEHRIVQAPGLWVVTLLGQPITMIECHLYQDMKRYCRVSFSQPAHANRLADQLNRRYQTQDFVVVKVL